MQIIGPNSIQSQAFVIAKGGQITLSATGLTGADEVVVEILELSEAPDFTGNPCCDLTKTNIQVIASTPLLCPDGRPVRLTAAFPFGALSAPQGVTLGARVDAAPDAVVAVSLTESSGSGECSGCICDRPCEDSVWTPTGVTRCNGTNFEAEEKSNCGTPRWAVIGPITWTATGEERCRNDLIEIQEADDCGKTRWTATATSCAPAPVYCPSLRISCDGQAGYGFHEMDPKDPAATVEMAPCAGDSSVDPVWIYPAAGPGHTVKVTDCEGALIGYAVNKSDCAADCGCPKDPVINVTNRFNPTTNVTAPAVTNNFSPTTNVAAPDVSITLPAPNLVAHALSEDGVLTSTLSNGDTVVSNPLPSC